MEVATENQVVAMARGSGAMMNVVDCKDLNGNGMMLAFDLTGQESAVNELIRRFRKLKGLRKIYSGKADHSGTTCIVILDKPLLCKVALESSVMCMTCPLNSDDSPVHWNLMVKDSAALKGVLNALGNENIDARISSISELVREDVLTHRQKEVLIKAASSGYFEFPRKMDLRELSHSLGVRPSTLSEILRSAQRKIVNQYLQQFRMPN